MDHSALFSGSPYQILPKRRRCPIPAIKLPLTSFGVCSNATLRKKLPERLMEPSFNHLGAISLACPTALARPDYEFWTTDPAAQEFPA
jgi:hypothetical protein